MHPTAVTELKLTAFRNYTSARLETGSRNVVLFGQNGSGKTNLLEALSFLSPGRGLRRAQYSDVANVKADGDWSVFVQLEGALGDVSIGTGLSSSNGYEADKTRKIRIDQEQVKSASDLLEHARVVWLTPTMDGLFTGPAGDRRRFLDRLVLAVDPAHGTRVNAFDKALRSRNKVLEEAGKNAAWLDAIEAQIAELGIAVAAARGEVVTLLAQEVETNTGPAEHFPSARLSLEGNIDTLVATQNATDAEDAYRQMLADGRWRDAAAKRTLDGPHRSDLLVIHGPKEIEARLCSTGEQKALLLGLVLAHAKLVGTLSGMTPIILLDEVAAHLDELRRAALYDVLEALNCQTWMTGTDRDLFAAMGTRADYFRVHDGNIKQDI